ncbi:hypothetical protein G7Y79_00009g026330 [Physcia stellaris]|nr:hypothetical protein G7Y79_00009g026330 [Physcia stellaris]
MGQRHQIFIIARIGTLYRTLAALHCQWLFGIGPLERCLHLLSVLSTPRNRIPLLQELRAAHVYGDRLWTAEDPPFQPFPFIATCLTVGGSFEPEVGYQQRVRPLSFNTGLEDIDNDDGITVVDVSDPYHLAYCFAEPVELRPLTGGKYLAQYESRCDRPDLEEESDSYLLEDEGSDDSSDKESTTCKVVDNPETGSCEQRVHELNPTMSTIEKIDSYPLIPSYVLQSTFVIGLVEDFDAEVHEPAVRETHIKPLSDLAMEQAFAAVLADPFDSSAALACISAIPNFKQRLHDHLLHLAAISSPPSTSTTASHLNLAFTDESTVDLSPFRNLSSSQIKSAASAMLKAGKAQSLDLSHLTQLSEADIRGILDAAPEEFSSLYLLSLPQISIPFVSSLYTHPRLSNTAIYHTALFSRPFNPHHTYNHLLTLLSPPSPSVSRPKPLLSRIFFARLLTDAWLSSPRLRKPDGTTPDWSRADILNGNMTEENSIHAAVFPLQDTYLPLPVLLNGLINFLTCAWKRDYATDWMMGINMTGYTLAKALASAGSSFGHVGEVEIRALPELLWAASAVAAKVSNIPYWPLPFPEMQAGEWSAVLVNEHDPYPGHSGPDEEKYRIAFVALDQSAESGYRVEGMEGWLKEVVGAEVGDQAMEYWKMKVGFVGDCGGEEAMEVVDALRRNMDAVRELDWWNTIQRGWNK